MGFAQWAAFGLEKGLRPGPIWASPLETKWDKNGLTQMGPSWVLDGQKGLSWARALPGFLSGFQVGPKWAKPSKIIFIKIFRF